MMIAPKERYMPPCSYRKVFLMDLTSFLSTFLSAELMLDLSIAFISSRRDINTCEAAFAPLLAVAASVEEEEEVVGVVSEVA